MLIAEPQIVKAVRLGSILENVNVDPWTRAIDHDDDSITENARATYGCREASGCRRCAHRMATLPSSKTKTSPKSPR